MRRIVAVVMPDVPLVLARRKDARLAPPLAVVVDVESGILAAVDDEARRHRVREGQTAVQAAVRCARLAVAHVTRGEIEAELSRVAELLLDLAPTVATRLSITPPAAPHEPSTFDDTVWLDVTGAAHLVGGEAKLLELVASRLAMREHRVRLAIASGPRIAQALARWSRAERVRTRIGERTREHEVRALSLLPIEALPLDAGTRLFLTRVGLRTLAHAMALPREQLSARLASAPNARTMLDLLEARDATPLMPYAPPRVVAESMRFEEGLVGTQPLAFVLGGMSSRLAAHLVSRSEAAGKLRLELALDRRIAQLAAGESASAELALEVALPVPLADAAALSGTLMPVIERAQLVAPVIGVRLEVSEIAPARRVQLDLSRERGLDPDRLPHLLAELVGEVGPENVGFLAVRDAHRPESRSVLSREAAPPPSHAQRGLCPTRLLPAPIALAKGPITRGARLVIGGLAYVVERAVHLLRLDGVEWWRAPVSRDYFHVALVEERARERADALVFVDRATTEAFVQGWLE